MPFSTRSSELRLVTSQNAIPADTWAVQRFLNVRNPYADAALTSVLDPFWSRHGILNTITRRYGFRASHVAPPSTSQLEHPCQARPDLHSNIDMRNSFQSIKASSLCRCNHSIFCTTLAVLVFFWSPLLYFVALVTLLKCWPRSSPRLRGLHGRAIVRQCTVLSLVGRFDFPSPKSVLQILAMVLLFLNCILPAGAVLDITSVQRANQATTGGATITAYGTDFTRGEPGDIAATVGMSACSTTTWLSSSAVQCLLSAGFDESLSATITVLTGGSGLSATYYESPNFETPRNAYECVVPAEEYDSAPCIVGFGSVDFSASNTDTPFSLVNDGVFSARWMGRIRPHATTSEYTFTAALTGGGDAVDERVKLWIDNSLLIDQWASLDTITVTATAVVPSTQLYDIKVEYKNTFGGMWDNSQLQLKWETDAFTSAVIPSHRLYPPHIDNVSIVPVTLYGAVSFDVGIVSSASRGNHASLGGFLTTLSGSNLGTGSYSVAASTSHTACQATNWISDTIIMCKTASGFSPNLQAIVTAGGHARTLSYAWTFDVGWILGVGLVNLGTTGQGSMTVSGADLGSASYSVGAGAGETGCEATDWVSDSSVACKAGAGVGGSLRAVVTVGSGAGTVTEALSFDQGSQTAYPSGNAPTSGQGSMAVSGADLGQASYSIDMQLGKTMCEATDWVSDSSVACKAGAVVGGSLRAVVTAAMRVYTLTQGASYDVGSGSVVGLVNLGTTGQGSMTVSGADLGRVSYSVGAGAGETGCEATEWESETSIRCLLGGGVRGTQRVSVTAGQRVGSVSEVYSTALGRLSVMRRGNRVGTGSTSVTVQGANMGLTTYTGGVREGQTGCEATGWESESSMKCRVGGWPASGVSGTQHTSMTACVRQGSMTEAISYGNSLSVSRYSNGASTGSASITLHGMSLGFSDASSGGRISATACEVSGWGSDSSVRSMMGAGVAGTSSITVTVGMHVGSTTAVYSFDASTVSTLLMPRSSFVDALTSISGNTPSTGSISVTLVEGMLGHAHYSSIAKVGHSICERSDWMSSTTLQCFAAAGVSGSTSLGVTTGSQVGSISCLVSYDAPAVRASYLSNAVSTGSVIITIIAGGMATASCSDAGRIGSTAAETSRWLSYSAVSCMPAHGVSTTLRVMFTAGQNVGSITEIFSYTQSLSGTLVNNYAATGAVGVTVLGDLISVAAYSAQVRLGGTAVELTVWQSSSSVMCLTSHGLSATGRLSLTAFSEAGSLTEAISFDLGVWRVVQQNRASVSGSSASFCVAEVGVFPSSIRAGVGQTACEATVWESDSSVACRGIGQAAASLRLVVTAALGQHTLSDVVSFDVVEVLALGLRNIPKSWNGSLTVSGLAMGGVSKSIVAQIADTVCQSTRWQSHSSVRCAVANGGPGSLTTRVTAGMSTGTITETGSYDVGSGSVYPANGYLALNSLFFIRGVYALHSRMERTPAMRLGETACEKTTWLSTSSVACFSGKTLRASQMVVLSLQCNSGSLTQSWSGDMLQITDVLQGNTPITSASVLIQSSACVSSQCISNGSRPHSSPSARLGFTGCEQTNWLSSATTLLCKTAQGLGQGGRVILSASSNKPASLSSAFTFDLVQVSAVDECNVPLQGGVAVILEGRSLGTSDYSPTASGGHTSCTSSKWISDSSIQCMVPAIGMWGSSLSTVSIALRVATASHSFSYDVPVCVSNSVYPHHGLALAACQCVAGYTGRGDDVCRSCRPGTYKSVVGSAPCTSCGNDTYSPAVAARNSSVCLQCPLNTQSESGSWALQNCTCKPGYVGDTRVGSPCTACQPGKFQAGEKGSGTCTSCPKDTYSSAPASTSCLACAGDYFSRPGSSQASNCSARAASVRLITLTQSCSSEVYSTIQVYRGIIAQVAEVQLSYVEVIYESITVTTTCIEAATSALFDVRLPETIAVQSKQRLETDLTQKSAQESVPEMSVSDTIPYCGNGRQPQDDHCRPCPKGWFKTATKNESCTRCPENSDTETVQAMFLDDCVCNAGYSGEDGGNCTWCPPGTYKDGIGSAPCILCPSSSFLPYSAADDETACLPCPSFGWSEPGSTERADCLCAAGYTGANGEPCQPCGAGTFKGDRGPAPCLNCPAGSFSLPASSSCILCPSATFSQSVEAPSLDSCLPCIENSWSPMGSQAQSDCICNAGYFGADGAACTACPAGKYKHGTGSGPCDLCRANTFSQAVGATNASACQRCPQGLYSPAGSNASSDCSAVVASFQMGVATSVCVGSSPFDEEAFTAAFAALTSHRIGHVSIVRPEGPSGCSFAFAFEFQLPTAWADEALQTLQRNFTVALGSDDGLDAWVRLVYMRKYCGQGRMPLLSDPQCLPCPRGWWKAATKNETCLPCPNNSDTVTPLSISRADCRCNAGYVSADGMDCVACPAGKYKDVSGPGVCLGCPIGTWLSFEGATVLSACKECPFGRYRLESTATGSADVQDPNERSFVCVCQDDDWKLCARNQFFTCEAGGPLCRNCNAQPCTPGFRTEECSPFSDQKCLPCPSTKPANSNFDTEPCTWVCIDGFFLAEDQCFLCSTAPCEVGWYRPRCDRNARPTKNAECTPCSNRPENALYVATAGATSECVWECLGGYFRNVSTDDCIACSVFVCAAGQFYSPCSQTEDATCRSCTNAIPENSHFVGERGECQWQCNFGYKLSRGFCSADLAAFSRVEFDVDLDTSSEVFESIKNEFEGRLANALNATADVSAVITSETFERRSGGITVRTSLLVPKARVEEVTQLLTHELVQAVWSDLGVDVMAFRMQGEPTAPMDPSTTPAPGEPQDGEPADFLAVHGITLAVSLVAGIALVCTIALFGVYRWRRRAAVVVDTPRKEDQESGVDGVGPVWRSGSQSRVSDLGWGGQRPVILAFFAQNRSDKLNTGGESQRLMSLLGDGGFQMEAHGQPTFDDFSKALMSSKMKNTQVVHMAGHADTEDGFYFLKDRLGLESEAIDPRVIVSALADEASSNKGTVQCVILNACNSEGMAKDLRAQGMPHVIGWRGKVADDAATKFSKAFYESLQRRVGHGRTKIPSEAFALAFRDGVRVLQVWQGRTSRRSSLEQRAKKAVENVPTEVEHSPNIVLLWSKEGDDESCVKMQSALDQSEALIDTPRSGPAVAWDEGGASTSDPGDIPQESHVLMPRPGGGNPAVLVDEAVHEQLELEPAADTQTRPRSPFLQASSDGADGTSENRAYAQDPCQLADSDSSFLPGALGSVSDPTPQRIWPADPNLDAGLGGNICNTSDSPRVARAGGDHGQNPQAPNRRGETRWGRRDRTAEDPEDDEAMQPGGERGREGVAHDEVVGEDEMQDQGLGNREMGKVQDSGGAGETAVGGHGCVGDEHAEEAANVLARVDGLDGRDQVRSDMAGPAAERCGANGGDWGIGDTRNEHGQGRGTRDRSDEQVGGVGSGGSEDSEGAQSCDKVQWDRADSVAGQRSGEQVGEQVSAVQEEIEADGDGDNAGGGEGGGASEEQLHDHASSSSSTRPPTPLYEAWGDLTLGPHHDACWPGDNATPPGVGGGGDGLYHDGVGMEELCEGHSEGGGCQELEADAGAGITPSRAGPLEGQDMVGASASAAGLTERSSELEDGGDGGVEPVGQWVMAGSVADQPHKDITRVPDSWRESAQDSSMALHDRSCGGDELRASGELEGRLVGEVGDGGGAASGASGSWVVDDGEGSQRQSSRVQAPGSMDQFGAGVGGDGVQKDAAMMSLVEMDLEEAEDPQPVSRDIGGHTPDAVPSVRPTIETAASQKAAGIPLERAEAMCMLEEHPEEGWD